MFSNLSKSIRFLLNVIKGIGRRQLGLIAAGIAFYGLLAIFPAITSLVTLWGLFADPELVEQQFLSYHEIIPEAAYNILYAQVSAIANGPKEVLGWASALSFLAALWATRAGVSAMIGGLNAVYGTRPRGGLRSLAMAFLLTLILIAVALVAMGTVVVAPVLLSFLPLGQYTGLALDVVRWLIGIGVVLLGIGLLFRLGPNRQGARSDLISPGSVLAVVLWAIVSWGFSSYLTNFGNYNEVYGSLGAVIAMLMWFYLSAFVVLLGGLVNAELEQLQVTRDLMEAADPPFDEPDATPDDAMPVAPTAPNSQQPQDRQEPSAAPIA